MWDVRVSSGGAVAEGVVVAGFRDEAGRVFDEQVPQGLELVVLLNCTPGSLRVGGAGRESGGFVASLALSGARVVGVGIDCVEVRFSPLQAASVLGVPPGELGGSLLDLSDLWGREADTLHDQLVAATSWEERFALANGALARSRAETSYLDAEVADAWRRITARRGRLRIADLAMEYGWSRTRLWQRFKAQLGLTPKRAAMIARFEHATQRLVAGAAIADVAVACGYADQAHLNRDVLHFSGRTPRELQSNSLWGVDAPVLPQAG